MKITSDIYLRKKNFMLLSVPKTLDFFDKVVQRKYSKKKKSRANLKKVVRPLFQLIGYFIRLQLEVKLFYIKGAALDKNWLDICHNRKQLQ